MTAGCLGQMTFTKEQAETVGRIFELPPEAIEAAAGRALQGLAADGGADRPAHLPLLRAGEVYGTTWKELIHEEFGDGIMSAIDFEMDMTRLPDPKGDRVKIVMHGKFLPYKTY